MQIASLYLLAMLSCNYQLLKITSWGIYQTTSRDLSLINHPCCLGYKGEVGHTVLSICFDLGHTGFSCFNHFLVFVTENHILPWTCVEGFVVHVASCRCLCSSNVWPISNGSSSTIDSILHAFSMMSTSVEMSPRPITESPPTASLK